MTLINYKEKSRVFIFFSLEILTFVFTRKESRNGFSEIWIITQQQMFVSRERDSQFSKSGTMSIVKKNFTPSYETKKNKINPDEEEGRERKRDMNFDN